MSPFPNPTIQIDERFIWQFTYKNYRGEISLRKARPLYIEFGSNEYHTISQWLMSAFDYEKNVIRIFAMSDMSDVVEIEEI